MTESSGHDDPATPDGACRGESKFHRGEPCPFCGKRPEVDPGDAPGPGPVESSYRTWVAGLGRLSPRQTAEAEHLYALARQLDIHTAAPAAAVASVSRAIGKTADRLRDEKNAAGPAAGTPAADPDIVDEIGARRQQRRGAS